MRAGVASTRKAVSRVAPRVAWARRVVSRVASGVALLLALCACGAPMRAEDDADARPDATELAASPPNIVLVLVDDLGWRDVSLGPHTLAEPLLSTPSVDRLAREGVSFSDAYASAPVCTPTRTSLLTGTSPARSHITYWILHAGQDTTAAWPGLVWPDWNTDGLQPGAVTLPALLSAAGYRTIHVGKAHLGAEGTPGADPRALGFDVNVAGHGAGAPASYLGTDDFAKGSVWDVPGLERWHGKDVFLTEALAAEAERAVRDAVSEGMPFFLHFAPYALHTPIMANPRLVGRYADRVPAEAAYASMVASVDEALGRLLDLLDELGLADDTLVLFTSDNGGLAAHSRGGEPHSANAPLRSGKGSFYEGGLRVPLVVRWPGVTEPGRLCATPVVSHDLFPTLLAAAGVPLPDDRRAAVDGRDLRALLSGVAPIDERELLWHQPHFWGVSGPGIEPFSALRRGRWKLVWTHADGRLRLFDLVADPGEAHDQAARRPEVVSILSARLGAALRDAGAQLPRHADGGSEVLLPGRS